MNFISIAEKTNSGNVIIGDGVVSKLSDIIYAENENGTPSRVAFVAGENIPVETIDRAISSLTNANKSNSDKATSNTYKADNVYKDAITYKKFTIKEGEKNKNLQAVEKLSEELCSFGLTRADVIISIGGGLVSDIVGFCASIYHRGVSVINIATTLLAQVDAAIGGKTAVNLKAGKNLVGSFHQPRAIICDTEALKTLPEEELKNGFGEISKYQLIADTLISNGLLDYFSEINLDGSKISNIHSLNLNEQIAICVGMKLFVVSQDEKESSQEKTRERQVSRTILNYGHTLAHALEVVTKFKIGHGQAVAVGLLFAAELAYDLGRISSERVVEHYQALKAFELMATELELARFDKVEESQIVELMKRDKKRVKSDDIVFVLDGENGIEQVKVKDEAVVATLKTFKAKIN